MSENLVNDVKRLERIGDELSGTNQKLLAAVSRVVNLIVQVVPSDLHDSNLGMNYRVYDSVSPLLVKGVRGGLFDRKGFVINVSRGDGHALQVAHQFANDVTKGLLGQICDKLNRHLIRTTSELNVLEQGEALLKKNLPQ